MWGGACQKEDALPVCTRACTTLTGRLLTAGGQRPLPRAEVTASWRTVRGLRGSATRKARTETDANGFYSLSFAISDAELADGFCQLNFAADPATYYSIGEPGFGFHDLGRDTTVQVPDYLIPRKAFVRLVLTNPDQLPAGPSYLMTCFYSCYGTNLVFSRTILGGGACVGWNRSAAETTLPLPGDQPMMLEPFIHGNSAGVRQLDSLFVPAGTTRTYFITY
ncbi:hypothetical protein GCM10023186_44570 [Hymenobacter koreensis]|uniref:Carboxypeptidase regulatory-like domain-containing protein n=1 Tax=Hymenobacter koreensis TaxID=1084523 RepID=A0ABP8JMI0_9BACT